MGKPLNKPNGKRGGKPEDTTGKGFNEQDPKRRLGQFTGAGEHSLQGSRNKGIVGHHDHNQK